ncbi:hypothetical protein AYO40_01305 [Planctomycetaceae bacterium SCGC AG-212-D15]|nr:hypothetical protein AYO40_01305 [Planctomycetaceae bacterium SCGC AG-212-D15]
MKSNGDSLPADHLVSERYVQPVLVKPSIVPPLNCELHRQLVENIKDVFWMADPRGPSITYVSPHYEVVWGRSCQSLYDQPLSWMDSIHEEDRPGLLTAYGELLRGAPMDAEYRVLRPDGSMRWVRDRGFPMKDDSGQVYRILGVAEDISHFKEAEQGLERSLAEEKRALATSESFRKRFEFISRVSALLSTSADYHGALGRLASMVTPYLADWCTVDLISELGDNERVASSGCTELRRPDAEEVVAHVMTSRQTLMTNDLSHGAIETRALEAGRIHTPARNGISSYLIVPMLARDRLIGAFSFIVGEKRRGFTFSDLMLAEEIVQQAAIMVDNAQLLRETQRRQQELKALALELDVAEEANRRRLALDLHDSVGQLLSTVKLELQEIVHARREPSASTRFDHLVELINAAITQTRELTFDLYPATLDDLGLVPTLRWYANRFAQRAGIAVQISESGVPAAAARPVVHYLFRAVKELLNNVHKHARATEAVVAVYWSATKLRVTVTDNGCGIATPAGDNAPRGVGLIGIRERVVSMDGHIEIESLPAHGTNVILEVPIDQMCAARHDEPK